MVDYKKKYDDLVLYLKTCHCAVEPSAKVRQFLKDYVEDRSSYMCGNFDDETDQAIYWCEWNTGVEILKYLSGKVDTDGHNVDV